MASAVLVALACPACVEALGSGVYEGYLWGMGVMMATPFVLLIVVGGGLVYERRRALRERVDPFLEGDSTDAGRVPSDRTGGET